MPFLFCQMCNSADLLANMQNKHNLKEIHLKFVLFNFVPKKKNQCLLASSPGRSRLNIYAAICNS